MYLATLCAMFQTNVAYTRVSYVQPRRLGMVTEVAILLRTHEYKDNRES